MLQQTDGLLLNELVDHIAKDRADSVETLICLTDVRKPNVIQQNLLNDEDRDGLAQL